jgi:hypothetical protein
MALDASAASALIAKSRERLPEITVPVAHNDAARYFPEAQNALRSAVDSCKKALEGGAILNRLKKTATGVAPTGNWTEQAQDSLRATVLFAGAGLDTSLKRLLAVALPVLARRDAQTRAAYEEFAEKTITDKTSKSIDPGTFVEVFLRDSQSPYDYVLEKWIADFEYVSAQSLTRVSAIVDALGVTDKDLRARVKPDVSSSDRLRLAFEARNEIAHSLDVTAPLGDVRAPLEKIRRRRTALEVAKYATETLTVTQLVINDVAARMS